MTDSADAVALAMVAAFLPVAIHFGALRGAPLRPSLRSQKTTSERLVFRHLPTLFVVNGGLVGCTVFFGKTGIISAAIVLGLLALPGITVQLTGLVIAKARDVIDGGERAAKGS